MLCPYCNSPVKITDSKKVYSGKSYGMIYLCSSYPICDAYVGVHKDTNEPLGRLANKELRKWKQKAHYAFDPLWKEQKANTRPGAYRWLAKQLGISFEDCHIGMFDIKQCKDVISICQSMSNYI